MQRNITNLSPSGAQGDPIFTTEPVGPLFNGALGKDCTLKVFYWCDGQSLLGRAALVCQSWYTLIMDPENHKNLLFRPVADAHVYIRRRSGDLGLARNLCEQICITPSVDKEDIDYFKVLSGQISQEIVNSEGMRNELLKSWNRHNQCKSYVKSLVWQSEHQFNEQDVSRLQNHIDILVNFMFNFLTDKYLNQGYGVLIPWMLQKLLPNLDNIGRNKLAYTLTFALVGYGEILAKKDIYEEAPAFFTLLKDLYASKDLEVQKNASAALAFMTPINLLNQAMYDPWTLLFDRFEARPEIREYVFEIVKSSMEAGSYEQIDFGGSIIILLESENPYFLECLKANIEKFVEFLEKLISLKAGLVNQSTIYALLAIVSNDSINLESNVEQRIRLDLKKYFGVKVELSDKKIKGDACRELIDQQFMDLCFQSQALRDELFDALFYDMKIENGNDYIQIIKNLIAGEQVEAKIIDGLEGNLGAIITSMMRRAADKDIGFYIPYVIEKLMLGLTDFGMRGIIYVFKSELHNEAMIRFIEKDFNGYLKIIQKLCSHNSDQVKGEVAITLGIMALNLSECYRNSCWDLFLTSISEDGILQYVSREISLAEGVLKDEVKLNFAEKIRELLLENCTSFIQYFNERSDQMVSFLNHQLSSIRKIDIKVDVALTLIIIAIDKSMDNDEINKKIKDMLLSQMQNTSKLFEEIKKRMANLSFPEYPQRPEFKKEVSAFIDELSEQHRVLMSQPRRVHAKSFSSYRWG